MYTFELNSIRRDDNILTKINKTSPVVEIFSAWVDGKELSSFGKKADVAVNYIKALGEKAINGDGQSAFELNTLRRYSIEPKLLNEIKLLGLFGTYEKLGYGETPEVETYEHQGAKSRFQANNGDVVFPTIVADKYQVGTQTVSGGFAVDYRKIAMGDMSKENEGMEQVRIDIRNKASLYVITTIYNAIKNATGVKYFAEDAGITQTDLDGVLTKIRRWGKPNILGDYSVVSQVNAFVPYTDGGSTPITGIPASALEEIRKTGLVSLYKGAVVVETPNQYDVTKLDSAGTNFATLLPEGLLFIVPQGGKSPVKTWTRGGLTSFTGNDVATGKVMTRFDLEVAADVARGQEYKIGLISDTSFTAPTV